MHSLLRRPLLLCLLSSAVLLSGCGSVKRLMTGKPQAMQASEQNLPEREAQQLAQCQKELDALQALNVKQYRDYKQGFERLMGNAAQYAGVRSRVNDNTQETLDALYRYKAKRLCANMSQVLLTGLADIGERIK